MPTSTRDRVAELEQKNTELARQLEACRAELKEALAQQTATAEVLEVINSSPGDLAPVFDAMLENAMALCEAAFGGLWTFDGDRYVATALRGVPDAYAQFLARTTLLPGPGSAPYRFRHGERAVIQNCDLMDEEPYRAGDPQRRALVDLGGARTALQVPLVRDDVVLGVITIYRQEVRPFSDKQIALLQNFAAQAVIAMENARLLGETREALAQQTATAEVLRVINASPGDLAPVFEAILDKAHSLCGAAYGSLHIADGEDFRAVAIRGMPEAFADFIRHPLRPGPNHPVRELADGAPFAMVINSAEIDDPIIQNALKLGGMRTGLFVPLRKEKVLLGYIVASRPEVRPFTEKQIALLENFAAQAVVAMENARLLTETREALEQQTATAEVLQVINSSPGDLAPVFDALLEKALRLCEASFGFLTEIEGKNFRAVALRGASSALAEFFRQPQLIVAGQAHHQLMQGTNLVHVEDFAVESVHHSGDPALRALADLAEARTGLCVALRNESTLLGAIVIYRKEVRRFSDKQIALLQNFAAQAVIAMQNARLLTETRETLEQQTATAEVLQVINSSPGDLAPVFDAILEKAHTLCGADHGSLFLRDGDHFRSIAARGVPEEFAEHLRRGFRGNDTPLSERLLAGEPFVQIQGTALAERLLHRLMDSISSNRTVLSVPLRKADELFGMIVAGRFAVQPFTDKQIALLQNFAAQAVIAMENARLLTETREALAQQTATAEVLQVINSSPGDLAPVFQAMLHKAHTLCEASFGALMTYDGERFHAVAHQGTPAPFQEFLSSGVRPGPGDPFGRMAEGAALSHIHDLSEVAAQHPGEALPRAAVDLGGIRTLLVVPLRKDNALLGAITAYRQEVRPFSDKQIALLQNFAAQAVIAIENGRLLGELRQRTGDLQESLVYQTAVSDVLKVISRSTFDLDAVLQAMVTTAIRLCRADHAVIYRNIDGEYRWAAGNSLPAEYERIERETRIRPGTGTLVGRVGLERSTVHILDAWTDPLYEAKDDARIGGVHTMLGVPLLRDGSVIGVIGLARARVEAYTEKEIELVATFADQAVIAIENARLIGELQDRTRDLEESLEYQTATSNVLQVISRSTFDLQPVLDTLLETAARLCAAEMGLIALREGGVYPVASSFAFSAEFNEIARNLRFEPGRGSVTGRTALERRVVHVDDIAADPEYAMPEVITIGRMRTALGVPLLRESEPIGVLYLARQRVESFTERQIELVRIFADQAVIAIENTRLITETREALEQQTATAEVLQVINSSPGELAPVFDAMLQKAMRLCEAKFGTLWTWDGECMNAAAVRGASAEYTAFLLRGPHPPSPIAHQPLLNGATVIHIDDLATTEGYRSGSSLARAVVELGGVRTLLAVPLRKDAALLGVFSIYRDEVRPFTEKQVALLESFAAQAVIAMDNARLLGEIRQRQAELRVTFDNMGDGVAMFDAEQRLAAWNMNFQRILDLPDEFVAGRPSLSDYVRHLATQGEYGAVDVEAEVRRLVAAVDRQWSTERTRSDGRVVEVRVNPVPGGGFVLIYSDITERKRAEAEIRAARDAAEKALGELKTAQASLVHAEKMASLGQLTAGIAHEIKNPLNFVNNFSGVSIELLDELKDAAAPALAALGDETRGEVEEIVATLTGNLEKIAEHGRRADGIVTSMLDHSRGGSGERRRVDINQLVDEALNLAFHGARAQDRDFTISLDRDFDPEAAAIELVPQDVTRVLLNLFANGFYAADRRRRDTADARFRSALTVATRDLGEAVEIRVRDNGTGIPPEHRDKLFQPFFTTKPTGEGTGLGLSICWDIVTQQHGGTIAVDSAPGDFTEFTVRLPRAPHTAGRAA